MFLDSVFLFCAAIALMLLIALIVNKRIRIKKLKRLVKIFIENYEEFRPIIDQDLDLEGISKEMYVEYDISSFSEQYYTLDFETREEIKFCNTKELRRGFLVTGSLIMEYEEYIRNVFGYEYDKTEYFEAFIEALRSIRRCCLVRNEETTVSWKELLNE